jgi:hypothetical protein
MKIDWTKGFKASAGVEEAAAAFFAGSSTAGTGVGNIRAGGIFREGLWKASVWLEKRSEAPTRIDDGCIHWKYRMQSTRPFSLSLSLSSHLPPPDLSLNTASHAAAFTRRPGKRNWATSSGPPRIDNLHDISFTHVSRFRRCVVTRGHFPHFFFGVDLHAALQLG